MISYRKGYKYQLAEGYEDLIHIAGSCESEFISLSQLGFLTIRNGYAWDGPSGPTIDTKTFMRGSLVHDALYQLMREGLLDRSCRKAADQELRRICLEDGMSKIRAWWVYTGVRVGAAKAVVAASMKKILTAP